MSDEAQRTEDNVVPFSPHRRAMLEFLRDLRVRIDAGEVLALAWVTLDRDTQCSNAYSIDADATEANELTLLGGVRMLERRMERSLESKIE